MPISNRDRKKEQRAAYHAASKKFKYGHGGRAVRKKEESALGSKQQRQAAADYKQNVPKN